MVIVYVIGDNLLKEKLNNILKISLIIFVKLFVILQDISCICHKFNEEFSSENLCLNLHNNFTQVVFKMHYNRKYWGEMMTAPG